jgi:uncharacterized protein YecE (DUF72 family)
MGGMSKLYAGTSGFSYPTWKPLFYPADLPSSRFLDHYATRLNCVEVNYTFRHLPSEKTLETWIKKTPDGFLFCPKAHMRITHILKLRDAQEMTESFLNSLNPLGREKRLGPILFQLPPSMKCDIETLTGFLALLPKGQLYSFEFRHASWFSTDVYEALRKYNATLCIAEAEKLETPEVVTADFAYYRLRKPNYTPEDHGAIVTKVEALLAQNKDVHVFFKHEDEPEGALHAEALLRAAGN